MRGRGRVTTIYRGRAASGEWWIEDGRLIVTAAGRTISDSPYRGGLPSEIAEGKLWRYLQETDPRRPRFNWYRLRDMGDLERRRAASRFGDKFGRHEILALMLLASLGLAFLVALLVRVHDGRCRPGGFRGGLDCTGPARSDVSPASPEHVPQEASRP